MRSRRLIAMTSVFLALTLMSCTWSSQLLSSINSSINATLVSTANTKPTATLGSSSSQTTQATNTSLLSSTQTSSSTLSNGQNVLDLQSTMEAVYEKVNPSVVYIEVTEASTSTGGYNRFGYATPTPTYASGSGFVWDTSGDIVTNNHVVSGSTSINVTFSDGNTYPATVVGQDPNADLAVVKVSATATNLVPISVGDSTQVKVGEIAIAIGNPYGLQGSMSQGIISGLSRTLPVSEEGNSYSSTTPTYNIPEIIQTDAAINPGNSGGVLVDLNGQLIGVTTAIESDSGSNSGIGFVIPSAIVSKVVPSIISTGTYAHPYLGITGVTLFSALAKAINLPSNTQGVLVVDVTSGGPSDKAGLLPSTDTTTIDGTQYAIGGDVITAINGQTIGTFDDLSSYLFFNTKPGDKVTLTVLRNGSQKTIDVTLGTLPSSQ